MMFNVLIRKTTDSTLLIISITESNVMYVLTGKIKNHVACILKPNMSCNSNIILYDYSLLFVYNLIVVRDLSVANKLQFELVVPYGN